MVNFTVEIVTSKVVAIQFLRHRSFSFQEFSQRYAKVENFEPFELRRQADKNRQSSTETFDPHVSIDTPNGPINGPASEVMEIYLDMGKDLYSELLIAGAAKETARFILPMATETTLYMNGTVRSWIHFLALRDDAHAQLEAQIIAREIKKIFIKICPNIAKALKYV